MCDTDGTTFILHYYFSDIHFYPDHINKVCIYIRKHKKKNRQKYASDKNIFLDFVNKQVCSMCARISKYFDIYGKEQKKCNNIFNIILGYLT